MTKLIKKVTHPRITESNSALFNVLLSVTRREETQKYWVRLIRPVKGYCKNWEKFIRTPHLNNQYYINIRKNKNKDNLIEKRNKRIDEFKR